MRERELIVTHQADSFSSKFTESPENLQVHITIPNNYPSARAFSPNGGVAIDDIALSTMHILVNIGIAKVKRRIQEKPRPSPSVLEDTPKCPLCMNPWCDKKDDPKWGVVALEGSPETTSPMQFNCDCLRPICKGCAWKWWESRRSATDTDFISYSCPMCRCQDNEEHDLLHVDRAPLVATSHVLGSNCIRCSQRGRSDTPYTLRPLKRARITH